MFTGFVWMEEQKNLISKSFFILSIRVRFLLLNVWGTVAIYSRIRRDDNIVYSSSLLAKGFFPETHIQMMNKIRIKIRIAVMNAVPFSPKNFNEVKKSIGCIIARRSKKGVLPVLSPIGRYTWFLNINDWAALPLLMRKSITLPM